MEKREKHKGCSYGGFVGLNDEYIEGIFVSDEMQSCGIGKLLLDYIKDKKVSLRLNVYQKNARANSFYQREGFIIQCEGLDEATGEKERPVSVLDMSLVRIVIRRFYK